MAKNDQGYRPSLEFELLSGYPQRVIAGCDEVGIGCLAGPVVSAAAIIPDHVDYEAHPWLKEVTDSKQVSEKKRDELEPLIASWVRAYAIGVASVEEIDQINIYHAARLAMVRAVDGLSIRPDHILVDGNAPPKELLNRSTAIVKGDARSISIACASILAKVWRDRKMAELDRDYPGFGLSKHKGYPTPAHKQAIRDQGVRVIHRRSFAFIKEMSAI